MLGLQKCSTCQKALADLQAAGHQITFRDVTETPLNEAEREELLTTFGEKLVNRASLTWRAMTEDERGADPITQLGAKPALMKRPAILAGDAGKDGHWLGWTANVKRALGVPA
ncbi:hypothetical protein DRW48_12500 [Paracoccus suum]|uniref:Arsenate reductase n=1 Tax=Paracoccus suum TaxID=2259340 RepID=A0A344PPG2_9RHOB|nr:hypothetical protein DRW48_12500 [Paracoccus suum]